MAGKIKAQFFSCMSQQQELKNGSLLWRPKERNWDRCWYFDLVLTTSEYHPFPVSVIFSSALTDRAQSHQYPQVHEPLATSSIFHAWWVPLSNSAPTGLVLYRTPAHLHSLSLFLDLFPESCPLPLFQNSPTCVGNKSFFGHTKALLSWILTCEPNLGRELPSP